MFILPGIGYICNYIGAACDDFIGDLHHRERRFREGRTLVRQPAAWLSCPPRIVAKRQPPYVKPEAIVMAMSESMQDPNHAFARPLVLSGAALLGLLLALTLALWAHYGTTVFYEVILAGIAACF
jgi:hypothetical protein